MKKKILLMGESGVGKTSMRSMVFAGYLAHNTSRLKYTKGIEYSHIKFAGELVFHILDCGGRQGFMESYFLNKSMSIFKNVDVFIYVFDISATFDMDVFRKCSIYLKQYSPEAKIYCIINKIDIIHCDEIKQIVDNKMQLIKIANNADSIEFYSTSILNETVYMAWSHIIQHIMRTYLDIEPKLTQFVNMIEANEVFLIERSSMLIIAKRHLYDIVQYNNDTHQKYPSSFETNICNSDQCIADNKTCTRNVYSSSCSTETITRVFKIFQIQIKTFDTVKEIEFCFENLYIFFKLIMPNIYILIVINKYIPSFILKNNITILVEFLQPLAKKY
ncbi:hypothetical protein A3Q56_07027 [Intoshia linei]|uniref:Uncharacterized protein n=1 Tax=Intoshia linei TaxID=1819745 RepID=A0A177AVM5_9BILA|nr:hypothetical protein A3Q56_07027 [Intoshia linei]